jgi:hypothetical protein
MWREADMKRTKIAFVLLMFVAAATLAAHAQNQITVPGTAMGYFGNPQDQNTPLVPAISVTGPVTITVTYVSGQVCWTYNACVGPNGGFYSNNGPYQMPLQEANGVRSPRKIDNVGALIGVFVPAIRVNRKGFQAVDGTKNMAQVGIMPHGLFFIGASKSFPVSMAGTLYLGINDFSASDNSGSFVVTVSAQ